MLSLSSTLISAEIYVSPSGKDTNPGTQEQPLASLGKARDLVRPTAGKEAVTVWLEDGTYYLPETLVFKAADSGTAANPVIYRAVNEGKAVLSGGEALDLTWQAYEDGIFQAETPPGLKIDQLFIDGICQRMARYPNYDAEKKTAAYQGYAADAISKNKASGWADPKGGYIHAMHRLRWGGFHYLITGKKPNGDVTYEGGWQNNRPSGMHADFRMVENIFEELDAPGEWFHNAKTNTLYYMPEAESDLAKVSVEVVRLRHLVEFQGTLDTPVKSITLQGFVVRHAARTFMDTKEQMLRSDWTIYRGGAFFLTGTENISILDSEFDQVGGNAIFVSNYNRNALIKGCHIHDVGGSGVCFVGDPDAVRNPHFARGQNSDLSKIDRTPGPKTENYPAQSKVEDCLMHGIGRVERQTAGVHLSMAQEITVSDVSVYDCSRAGINMGDVVWGGNVFERLDVFDTVMETHDHGSFNSWGRDRYWHDDRGLSQKAVDKDPSLPFLDATKTTIIRDSRWRCDHGWDVDLDDGSSNFDIYNNLMLHGGLKLREGFRRRAWNNIMVNNSLHPHVWFKNSQDEVHSNIYMTAVQDIRAASKGAKGKRVDGNFFFVKDPASKDALAKHGWDLNSIVGDPHFVDPANGDFRVKEGSPAFKVGFKNFPMDQFGVKKPSLKAIAKTPKIPVLFDFSEELEAKTSNEGALSYWLGVTIKDLAGDDFSSYGVAKEDGGVALVDTPKSSEAKLAGFASDDLIQSVNGQKVKTVSDFMKVLAEIGDTSLQLGFVRLQKSGTITLESSPYIQVETAKDPSSFKQLPAPEASGRKVQSYGDVKGSPEALADGKIEDNYGPVFANGTKSGAYKMDLGAAKSVSAIKSWSFDMNDNRGPQRVSLFGSNSATDPGWDLKDTKKFTPLGSIDTRTLPKARFTGASLNARAGKSLGTFRWIAWRVSPVTKADENTAFQELSVDTID
ncbi:right-handed parallel beta-helix repeat-containing protein [Haloferula sp.]|uniref:right-handed parallel beta-helix repeat-containing protein n=1 Tax=Haloferula sp. TaxID=2497595 RepID=UPI00329E4F7C